MLRRLRSGRAIAALAALAVAGAVAAYIVYDRYVERPGDISNPDVEFVEPTATPEPRKKPGRKGKPKRVAMFSWPRYGLTKDHTRNLQAGRTLKGPFRKRWTRKASALTEFPPVLHRDVLYHLSDDGVLRARAASSGRKLWRARVGRLSASSPALDGRTVYVSLMEGKGGGGRVTALREQDGAVRWSRRLPDRTESSPLVHRERVYVGAANGTLYCLSAKSGRIRWAYRANGAIKGSPTLSGGIVYFGDYGGYVHAVGARSGRRVWAQPAAARALRGGRFYATAAVAYGRVYIGATDGREYALSARTGSIAWARQTGAYVYSSAAVANVPGRGPTVFFGSYDGNLYAVDARSGATRWTYRSGGKISGSPTVVGNVVYFSDLGQARTYGIDTRSGRPVFRLRFGAYDPVISDGRHLFVTGRRSLTAYLAKNAPKPGTVPQPRGTRLPGSRKLPGHLRAKRAKERRKLRAALRRCGRRDSRAARKRCRARVRRG